jgi:hypothetical protein
VKSTVMMGKERNKTGEHTYSTKHIFSLYSLAKAGGGFWGA